MLTRNEMAYRASKELEDGSIVNLGIGIPTLVSNYISCDSGIMLHTENGLLGMGEFPLPGEEDHDLINAGKQTITYVKGASFFSSNASFDMIRGGHIDVSILGAMQVSENRDIANWMIPGKVLKGMGGAMDLVNGSKKVIVIMDHCAKNQKHKLLKQCTLPITGYKCVDVIITNLGVFEFVNNTLVLKEISSGITLEYLKRNTSADFIVSPKMTTVKIEKTLV